MEFCGVTKNGSQREPCSCILANMDEDDVVMHDVDCSYCDGGFLETAFLKDNECDDGSCLSLHDVECTAEEDDAKFRTEEKGSVRCEVLERRESQLDKYIASLQTNNVRILRRFYEVQEDKKQAEWRDEGWRRNIVSLRVSFSPLNGHRSVSLVEEKKKKKKKNRRNNREVIISF